VLTFEQITALVELVATHRLAGVEIERSGFRLKIEGQAPLVNVPAAIPVSPALATAPPAAERPAQAPPPVAAPAAPVAAAPAATTAADHVLTSPIVGTFYRAPSPDAPNFVDVGTRVKKGQVLCIVEAMKLMNEIEADVDGVIVEIFPKNAQPVEFGEPLFAIRIA
jgi:acetyl-CoA carboxylase biotin carboxyl carrier protein